VCADAVVESSNNIESVRKMRRLVILDGHVDVLGFLLEDDGADDGEDDVDDGESIVVVSVSSCLSPFLQ